MQQGLDDLKKGKKMKDDAEAAFQSSVDPLGTPPEPPNSWEDVDAMARRAEAKQRTLQDL